MPPRRPAQTGTRLSALSTAARLEALEMALPALAGQAQAPKPTRLDLVLAWCAYDGNALNKTGQWLFSVGGVWDRNEGRYVVPAEEAETCRIFRVTPAQMPAAMRFKAWLEARRRGEPRDRVLMLSGRRRSGKGVLGLAISVSLALEIPGFPAFLVSGAEKRRGELDRDLVELPDRLCLPSEWWDYEVATGCYHLANGSRLQHVSGARPANIKQGGASCMMLNEAQEMAPKVFGFAMPAIADTGGLVVIPCNPPVPGSRGASWTFNLRESLIKPRSKFRGSVFDLDPTLNPFLDSEALADANAIVAEITPEIGAADASGEWSDGVDHAYPRWRPRYVVEIPDINGLVDITPDVTKRKCNGTAREWVLGHDPQGNPHQAGVLWKCYAGVLPWLDDGGVEREAEGTLEAPLFIAHHEIVLDEADDELWLDEVAAQGYHPKNTIAIIDPSGQWQGAKHDFKNNEPPTFKAYTRRGWRALPPREKKTDKGVHAGQIRVQERLGLVMTLMRAPRVFIAGIREGGEVVPACPWLAKAFQDCSLAPARRAATRVPFGKEAHITDAGTYALVRLVGDQRGRVPGSKPRFSSVPDARQRDGLYE